MIKANPKRLEEIRRERTLVVIKSDAVVRKIVGELLTRFERKGFKIVGMKLVWPDDELAARHYTDSEEWLVGSGTRTYEGYVERGITPPLQPRELGLNTRRKLMEHLTAGPVVAMALEGAHVVELVRRMRGSTNPLSAEVGTIGFDYTVDSYELADAGDWAIKNVMHASDSAENAASEIALWFRAHELYDYDTATDHVVYSKKWQQHHRRQSGSKSPSK
jgi:nucleoside-diphosphate kinase